MTSRSTMLLDFLKSHRTADHSERAAVRQRHDALVRVGDSTLATCPVRPVTMTYSMSIVMPDDVTDVAPATFCENNRKLGKGLRSFDMAPIISCPGSAHAICRELRPDGNADPKPICFGKRGIYRQTKMQTRLAINFEFSKTSGFVPWAIDKLARRRTVIAVRLPGVGDFYSSQFVPKVRDIVRARRGTSFWAYTRSWIDPEIWAELQKLATEPNFTLWLSWDRKMAAHHGPPPDRSMPWCWLAETDDDMPPQPVDLVWRYEGRTYWNQKLPYQPAIGGCLVCPHENGETGRPKVPCAGCGICWRGAKFRAAKTARLLDKHQE